MHSTTTKILLLLALAMPLSAAPSRINPFNQIDWTKVSGTTAPTATCSATLYGMPYTNTATGDFYVCASSGWVLVTGGSGSSVSVNGSTVASPNFNGTIPAAGTNGKNIAFQVSGSSISAQLVGDGTITHFLNGTGTYTTPAGGGTIGGSGTLHKIPKFTSTTDIGDSALDDGVTTASTITSTEPIAIATGSGVGGTVDLTEGTAATGASGHDVLYADSTAHCVKQSLNGGSFACLGSGGSSTALVSRVSCATYSCVADGNLGANTGTDNTTPFTNCLTAAIAAGGYCYIPAGIYRIATSLPTISVGGTGFVGDVYGYKGTSSSWTGPSTTIFSSSNSATILTISSGGSTFITGDVLQDIALQRSAAPATGSIGLLMDHAGGALIQRNSINDSAIGMDLTNTPSYGSGMIANNTVGWGYSTIGCGTPTADIGYNLHGSTGGFNSLFMQWNVSSSACTSGAPTSYGFKIDGVVQDLNMANNLSYLNDYGVYVVGTVGQDVHIVDQTDDSSGVECEHFDYGGGGNSTELRGGWCVPVSAATSGTNINNSRGIRVSNRQYRYGPSSHPSILLQGGSKYNAIQNNTAFQNFNHFLDCNASDNNSITDNTVDLNGSAAAFAVFTNCSNSSIMGNNTANGTATLIALDSSSNNNYYVNLNKWSTSGTAVSDSGTGNQFAAGTTTNALTMNNGGSGAASGSTFDGSAAKTISYNTVGAQQALTLTTTGSSGAATLSAGTLNIPQYSGGGGSGAWTNITGSGQVTATGCTQSASTGGVCTISGTSTAAVTFSVIPTTHIRLHVEMVTKGTSALSNINMTYNSDTSAHYAQEGMYALSNSSPVAFSQVNQSSCNNELIYASSTGLVAMGIVDIPFYYQTTFPKSAETSYTTYESISSLTNSYHMTMGCVWNQTTAITSVTFTTQAADFANGTIFVIYGVD